MNTLSDAELNEFRNEAEDLLKACELCLADVERGQPLAVHYNILFRTFHSLKGAAGIMELRALRDHMDLMETTLIERKHEGQLSAAVINNLRQGMDQAREIIHGTKPNAPSRRINPEVLVPDGRVLVIDDEPELVELISHILTASNLEVFGTSEPERVLEFIKEFRPDAIMTDISMPKMSGMDILDLVRRTYPDIPVVFVSGHVDKDSLLSAIELGVFAVIEKPFDLVRVIEAGRNAVSRHKLLKLLNRSINLVKYHFADLDHALAAQGKDDVRNAITFELENLVRSRRLFR